MKIYVYEQPAILQASFTPPVDREEVNVVEFDIDEPGSFTPGSVIYAVDQEGDQIASFDASEVVEWADDRPPVLIHIVPITTNALTS